MANEPDSVTSPADVRGLVPLRVDPTAREVLLADVHPDEFTDSFFEFTVRRIIDKENRDHIRISWDDLIAQSETWEPVDAMAGLLFNVGRCGSTLLCNMLKANPRLWVLSEPEPLSKPEIVSRRRIDLQSRIEADAIYKATSQLLQIRAQQCDRTIVVKYPSWLAARAPIMAGRHPNAAVFALHRDPHKVVASCIARPPMFAERIHHPAAVQSTLTPALAAIGSRPLTGATYHAAIWVSTMVGSMAVEPARLLILSYEQLRDNAAACFDPVMEHLGLPITEDIRAAGLEATTVYAKPGSGKQAEAFDPSGTHARAELSPRTKAEIDSVVGDVPAQLANHERHLEISA